MSLSIVFFLFSSCRRGRVYKEKAKFFETNYRLVKKLIEKKIIKILGSWSGILHIRFMLVTILHSQYNICCFSRLFGARRCGKCLFVARICLINDKSNHLYNI